MKKLALFAVLLATPAWAQNAPSGSPRVQGAPDGFGDPLQVTIVGPNGADVSGTTAPQVQGNVAAAATDSGNPVKVGGKFNSTPPSYTDGQRGDVQLTTKGDTKVNFGDFSTIQTIGHTFVTVPRADNGGGYPGTFAVVGFNGGAGQDYIRNDVNGLVVQKGLSTTFWYYSNGATGILSNTTTAVTIKAAAGSGVRNYIDSCTINTTAFGAAVPIVLRDGAAGTVRWAANVPTAGWLTPVSIVFNVPLQGTANTLWEVATPTANTSGTVWVSCQGHTGA